MEVKSQSQAKLLKSEEYEKAIKLLEERLEKHDNSRKAAQGKLTEILNKLTEQIDELEERINIELEERFASEEDRLQTALNELRGNSTDSALQEAKRRLSVVQSYEIIDNKEPNNDLTTLYELKTEMRNISEDDHVELAISGENSSIHSSSNTTEMSESPCDSDKFAEERERLIELLEKRLEEHDNNKKAVQNELHDICEGMRTQVAELEDRIAKELEDKFAPEDNRLQEALNELRGNSTASALQKAKAELLVEQSYEILENNFDPSHDLTTLYELKTERRIIPELMEMKKPINVCVTDVNRGIVSVQFTFLNPDEERVLSDRTIVNPVKYKCLFFKKDNEQESKEYSLDDNDEDNDSFTFTPGILEAETPYGARVKMVVGDRESEWSDENADFTTPEFEECCVWKKCPDDVDEDMKYNVNEKNLRVAKKVNDYGYCTIIGNTLIPLNTVTSWNIKILKSKNNDGGSIHIGVVPNDINQNNVNRDYCGWCFSCYDSRLSSGPPHNYKGKEYGPRKEDGEYVFTGDSVGVVMDTTKGELSFALDGVNLGVAYERIPLDKPLVTCILLKHKGDSVELDASEVKENVDSSIPVPSNIVVKGTTWDSVTLTWDEVADASFYQVEVDGINSGDASTENTFIKRGLLPETEHNFRVRAVGGSSVSEWSGVVKGRTQKAPEFPGCVWKECPDDVVDDDMKYSVDEKNPRVATKINYYGPCTIIGDTSIPLNTVTSWNIKVLKSEGNNGHGIHIGIAPFDINQNDDNFYSCGWYFDCHSSTLWSGPPHKYKRKEYGPRKGDGQYVHTGDSVGVVMDTTKGELSFVLDGVNCGVAYSGIPLDKPLVPCVILGQWDDSVMLDTSEVKENVDSSIPISPNIIAKSIAWDSITLTWDEVSDASFYQIEVDGSKSWGASTTNSFAKRGLLPGTEHSFRVRTVRGSSVSEWSDVVKRRTLNAPEFSGCVWKECPDDIYDFFKYSVDGGDPRIATKVNGGDCTIIGNIPIPFSTVTSWNIKVLKSEDNNGDYIYIGVAPFGINQNEVFNYNSCGWYFHCYFSALYSGPPHEYKGKEYGPRKGYGDYVHAGDSVGVVMDTTKGELSFVLDGVNLGVAYKRIPLDKPLVTCVILSHKGDSAELII